LSVRCGAFETILFVLPVEDFPTSAAVDLPVRFSIPAQSLRTLIDRTVFAISTEETRYYLNGIYMHVVDGALRAVATDGHRMAIMDQPLPDGAAEMKGVIIPRKTVAELRKLLAKYNGDVCIAAGGSGKIRIEFTIPGISLMSKAIDGTYPDYQRIIPTANDRMMQVGNKAFSEALGRVSAVSTERSRPVKMTLSKDTLVLASRNHNEGEAAEKLNGGSVVYAGDPVEIGFQARYLLDVLGAIGRDVSFSFVDGQSPTLIGDGDGMFTGILMPMRI
jgi:DNA polymerase-3 subunit beta